MLWATQFDLFFIILLILAILFLVAGGEWRRGLRFRCGGFRGAVLFFEVLFLNCSQDPVFDDDDDV